jgi:uncharacterized repeat protein (TIGR01451 family)
MKHITNKLVTIIGIVMTLNSLNAANALAKECRSVYGGGEVCDKGSIDVDKKVWNPEKNEYWDNIDSSDYTFKPGDEVKFEIKTKNVTDIKLNDITIRDIMPDYLEYVSSSDEGKFYQPKTVEFKPGDLDDQKTVTRSVTVRVKNSKDVPVGTTCLTNKAEAYASTDDSSDSDTATFCVKNGEGEKRVLGVTYPETGPSLPMALALEVIGFATLGGSYLITAKKLSK